MTHVPHRSQDIIGTAPLRDAIVFKAHDTYVLDGDDLNKLACLAIRLDMEPGVNIPLDLDERQGFATIIRYMLSEATRKGPQ